MAHAERKRVRLVPDTNGLILVAAVAAGLILAGGLSLKAVIGVAVLYAVTVATAGRGSNRGSNRGSGRRTGRG